MAELRPQSLANHRRWLPPFHFVALPILLANVVGTALHAWRQPSTWTAWETAVAVAVFLGILLSRVQTLVVQDRLIRLEMRLRFRDALPAALLARSADLTPKQLVGLRFAGDKELPGLVERCLSGDLKDGEAVKKQIKDWQPDWLRA